VKEFFIIAAAIAIVALSLAGCASPLEQYDRTYSLTYSDAEGRNFGTSVRLLPARSGLSK